MAGTSNSLLVSAARSKYSSPPVSIISWLTRWSRSIRPVISSAGARFPRRRLPSRGKRPRCCSPGADALEIAGPVGLELVEVQALQQLAVESQFQVGEDRAEVGFRVARETAASFSASKVSAEGPSGPWCPARTPPSARPTPPPRPPDNYSGRCSPVAAGRPPAAHHRVLPGDQRALQQHGVGRIRAHCDLGSADLDHRAATRIDLVEPDFQRRDWGLGTGDWGLGTRDAVCRNRTDAMQNANCKIDEKCKMGDSCVVVASSPQALPLHFAICIFHFALHPCRQNDLNGQTSNF